MKPVSLADITYEQGLSLLALRKQALDSGAMARIPAEVLGDTYMLRDIGITVIEKLAEGGFLDNLKSNLSNAGQQISETWQGMDPAAQTTLAGAGLGAATGLGSAMYHGKKHWGRNALMGGIAGGAMGGGVGLIADQLKAKPTAVPRIQEAWKGISDSFAPKAKAKAPADLKAMAEAEALNALSPSEADPKIRDMAAQATSRSPELAAGLKTGLIGGGTAAAYRRLKRPSGYSPELLAEHLRSRVDEIKGSNLDSFLNKPVSPVTPVTPPDTRSLLDKINGVNPPAPAAAPAPSVQYETGMQGKLKGMSTEEIADLIRKNNHGPNVFGNMKNTGVDSTKSQVGSLFGEADEGLEKLLKTFKHKGFKGRPIRGGLTGLALVAGLGGLTHVYNNYKNNKGQQDYVKNVLENLVNLRSPTHQ